ncbi:SUR7 protein [Coniochaeta sp. 2T2.1]|nr:SUR7 protein [Coniochaeta sp. 2T2.1]
MKLHFPLALPIICSLAATILTFLVLFAGNKPNFMEDAHIIMLNTSSLGKDLVPTPTSGDGDKPTSTDSSDCGLPGFLGKVCGGATSAVGSVATQAADALDDVADDIADKLADKLGIKEFYSLHVMDACEGDFTPNVTTPGAGYNVTNCTEPLKTAQYNITAKLDHSLSLGPLHLNLADLGFTRDLQDELNKIPRLLKALAVIYILAAGFTGLSLITSIAAVPAFDSPKARLVVLTNLGVAGLAVVLLLVGSLTTTVGARAAADKIDDLGEGIGLRARAGGKFIGMTWAGVGLMVVATGYWGWEMVQSRKRRVGGWREKPQVVDDAY